MCFETKGDQQLKMSLTAVQSYNLAHSFISCTFVYTEWDLLYVHITIEYSTLCISLIAQFSHNSFYVNVISVSLSLVLSFSLSSEAGDVTVGL